MTKQLLLIIVLFFYSFSVFSQEPEPDYTVIKFRSYVKEYKKKKPSFKNIKGTTITKEQVSDIVRLLGKSFYSKEERDEITEKIWLSFTDPKKFDYVFKDYAVRSTPNWNKPNFQGKIVLEPNKFLKDWTKADTELDYFKIAMHQILMYEGLMGYGETAKDTRKSALKLLYAKKYAFRSVYSKDWTNSYLQSLAFQAEKKGKVMLVTDGNYQFMICDADKKAELLKLFGKFKWKFIKP